jgi:hypothetical protein
MSSDKRNHRPEPKDAQTRRVRLKHGLSEPSARIVASLYYGGAQRG